MCEHSTTAQEGDGSTVELNDKPATLTARVRVDDDETADGDLFAVGGVTETDTGVKPAISVLMGSEKLATATMDIETAQALREQLGDAIARAEYMRVSEPPAKVDDE